MCQIGKEQKFLATMKPTKAFRAFKLNLNDGILEPTFVGFEYEDAALQQSPLLPDKTPKNSDQNNGGFWVFKNRMARDRSFVMCDYRNDWSDKLKRWVSVPNRPVRAHAEVMVWGRKLKRWVSAPNRPVRAHAEVMVWGRTVEHESGYRSRYMLITKVTLPWQVGKAFAKFVKRYPEIEFVMTKKSAPKRVFVKPTPAATPVKMAAAKRKR